MISKKLKWFLLTETVAELDAFFEYRNTVIHKTMFGEVLLVKEKNDFSAFKNECPHQGKPLTDCSITEGNVVCPFHKYHFSLENGQGHGLYLEKYPLETRDDGTVWIGKERWSLF